MKNKNLNEMNIAKEYLSATKEISQYSKWMTSYGEYKFKDKELGKLINNVRKSFYHDGSKKAIDKFHTASTELNNFINSK